MINNFF